MDIFIHIFIHEFNYGLKSTIKSVGTVQQKAVIQISNML